jgi:hypothetical protein
VRDRRDELSRNQLSIVLAVAAILLTLWLAERTVTLDEAQMDELVDRVSQSAPPNADEREIDAAVQQALHEREGDSSASTAGVGGPPLDSPPESVGDE